VTEGATRPDPARPAEPEPAAGLNPAAEPEPAALPDLAAGRVPAPVRTSRVAVLQVATTVAVVALGLPLGLLWAVVAPDVPVRVTDGGLSFTDAQPPQVVAGDGWFALLSVPFGILAAVGVWRWGRHVRGVGALIAVAVGMFGAGVLAWWVGRQLGLAGYEAALSQVAPGTVLERPRDLRVVQASWWPPMVTGVPMIPALAAAVTYTLLAAWSRFPDLRPDRSQPVDAPAD
jgi:hypothetical protein